MLQVMAGGNLAGRLGWAGVSDKIGRKATFNAFTFGSVPIFAALPYCINQVVMNPTGARNPPCSYQCPEHVPNHKFLPLSTTNS